MRHDTHAVAAQARLVVVRVFERDLVEEARVTGIHRLVVVQAERQENRFLQPLIDAPLAVDFVRDARFTAVEQRDGFFDGVTNVGGCVLGVEFGAALESGVDQGFEGHG